MDEAWLCQQRYYVALTSFTRLKNYHSLIEETFFYA